MLTQLLNSHTKAIILTRLFVFGSPRYHLRQLARDGGVSAPGLLKELSHFHALKLIQREDVHGRTVYFADSNNELFPVLCELVIKAEGLHGKIRTMLAHLDTQCVFIYGSEARGTARPDSDIDLFVIGKCSLKEVCQALLPAADFTNREINPVLVSPEDFQRKCQSQEHFVREVLQSPMIFLKGGKNELKDLSGQRMA